MPKKLTAEVHRAAAKKFRQMAEHASTPEDKAAASEFAAIREMLAEAAEQSLSLPELSKRPEDLDASKDD